jgi:hypothetical protein
MFPPETVAVASCDGTRLPPSLPSVRVARSSGSPFAGLDGQRVAGQGILFRQLDDLELEAAVFAFGAAFLEQHRHRNGKPVIAGAACVLARDLVEPAFAAPVSLK